MNPNLSSATKSYNITENGDTIIPGKLVLVAIVVNTKGGAGNTCQIFDSTATIGVNASRKKATLDCATMIGAVPYGIFMGDGIFLRVGSGTKPDLTLIYAETP